MMLPLSVVAVVVPLVAAQLEDGSVPFSVRDSSDIVISLAATGRRPMRFLLDTGSSRSAVTDRLARILRLPLAGKTLIVTPAGKKVRTLVHVGLELGRARKAVAAAVLLSGDLGSGIDGIIGTDLLGAYPFTIDYVRRRMVFTDSDRPGRGASMPLADHGHGFVTTVSAEGRQPQLRLIPDTGTASFVLFARSDRDLPNVTPLASIPLRSTGGLMMARAVLIERLQLGSILVRDQVAVLMHGSRVDGRLADGLLPLHIFASVTFDALRGSLTIVPLK